MLQNPRVVRRLRRRGGRGGCRALLHLHLPELAPEGLNLRGERGRAHALLTKLLRHGISASGAGVHVGEPGDGDGADIRGRLLPGFDAARHLERVVELRLVLFAQVLEVRRLLVLLLQLARQLPGLLLELGRALLRGEQASRGGCSHLICRATAQLGRSSERRTLRGFLSPRQSSEGLLVLGLPRIELLLEPPVLILEVQVPVLVHRGAHEGLRISNEGASEPGAGATRWTRVFRGGGALEIFGMQQKSWRNDAPEFLTGTSPGDLGIARTPETTSPIRRPPLDTYARAGRTPQHTNPLGARESGAPL